MTRVTGAMKSTDQEVTMSAPHNPWTTELHAVFATDGVGSTHRVSDPLGWDAAQREWLRLEDMRREGLLPQAKFFEVRSVTLGPDRPLVGPEVRSHGRYDDAPLNMMMTRPVASKRGFKNVEDAARAAWKTFAPTFTSRRGSMNSMGQGAGGWFYYPNGTTAAQGLVNLAQLCLRRKMVLKGADGRWYPVAQETL
jgi:hypothetical protein